MLIRCGFVIFTYDEKNYKMLDHRRDTYGIYLPVQLRWDGTLGFFGGLIDPEDKTIVDGVMREMNEEIGIKNVDANKLIPFKILKIEDENKEIHSYRYELSLKELGQIYENQWKVVKDIRTGKEKSVSDWGYDSFGVVLINLVDLIRQGNLETFIHNSFAGTAREELDSIIQLLREEMKNRVEVQKNHKRKCGFIILTYDEKSHMVLDDRNDGVGKCVLIKLRNDGKFGFYGGYIDEKDETIEAGAIRGVYNEIGMKLDCKKLEPLKVLNIKDIEIHSYRYKVGLQEIEEIMRLQGEAIKDIDQGKQKSIPDFCYDSFGTMLVPLTHWVKSGHIEKFFEDFFSGTARQELEYIKEVLLKELN